MTQLRARGKKNTFPFFIFSSEACRCVFRHSGGLATRCFSTPPSLHLRRECHDCSRGPRLGERRPLLRPQVTNIPSAFTKPSLRNQIHRVARQITSRRPPTPAQSSRISAPVPQSTPPPHPICQVETGCEKWLCFSKGSTGEGRGGAELQFIVAWLAINKSDH